MPPATATTGSVSAPNVWMSPKSVPLDTPNDSKRGRCAISENRVLWRSIPFDSCKFKWSVRRFLHPALFRCGGQLQKINILEEYEQVVAHLTSFSSEVCKLVRLFRYAVYSKGKLTSYGADILPLLDIS